MEMLGGGIVAVGIGIILVANTMIVIKAFKTTLLWGFGTLFIPIVTLAYIVLYWDKTKKYVLWLLIGLLLFVVGGTLYNMR
jgi:hypothetical protein